MPIADDWDFRYRPKVLAHIDGILSYDGGGGAQAIEDQWVYGVVSGAIGQVLAVTGNATAGTYTLTNVRGIFEDNEVLELASVIGFDTVTDKASNVQGIRVGDTVVDQVTGSIDVLAIVYNNKSMGSGSRGLGQGLGQLIGNNFTAFTDNSSLDISGGETGVALADTSGGNVDNDTAFTTTVVNGTMAVPGTVDTNKSVIIHYDAGTVAIPEQAIVQETTAAGARGLVEQVYGTVATGSLRIVDSNSSGAGGDWTDNISLEIDQVIGYNNLVAGKIFSEGDVVVGATSGATGRVLADTGTQLILADETGTWVTTEDLEVNGVKIADANGTNAVIAAATLNLPDGIRTEQYPNSVGGGVSQGGLYAAADGINIVRKLNSLYTLSQDTFDALGQMDDDEALGATGKGQAYQILFEWEIPDLSMRFLRKGGIVDTTGANVWANPQTVGAQNKITDTAFLYTSAQPFHQPQLYIEQNQQKIDPWWIEGNIDVLLKVRTWNDTRFIAPATPALGQLLPGGDPQLNGSYSIFNREFYTSTFDATQFDAATGGVNTVALGTSADNAADRNPQGTHTFAWDVGSAVTLVVGEFFTTGAAATNDLKVGMVVAQTGDAGAAGTVEYVLKSGNQFADNEACTAEVSGKTFTVDETGGFDATNDVVAGYGVDIRFQVADIAATAGAAGSVSSGFIPGALATQAVTGATGYVVYADEANDVLYLENVSGTFSGDNNITGAGGGTFTAGTGASYPSATTFSADLNNGEGLQPYVGSVSGDLTGASKETMQNVYQYSKYLARSEEASYFFEGPGTSDAGTVGRFFRKLKDPYGEIKPGNPTGVYTGSLAFAQGWFLDTGFIAAADIRSFTVIDDNGVTRAPPNLQSLEITNVGNGWRVAAYRSTGAGSTDILRNEFDVGVVGAGNNQAANSTVLVGANNRTVSPLPADVPDAGVLRILSPSGSNDSGNYVRMTYSSVNRTTNVFTLTDTIGNFLIAAGEASNDLTLNDNVHVCPIEEQAAGVSVSNTLQYVADIPIVYKARLKGFQPFRSTGNFTNTGASLGVVQTADAIVDLP